MSLWATHCILGVEDVRGGGVVHDDHLAQLPSKATQVFHVVPTMEDTRLSEEPSPEHTPAVQQVSHRVCVLQGRRCGEGGPAAPEAGPNHTLLMHLGPGAHCRALTLFLTVSALDSSSSCTSHVQAPYSFCQVRPQKYPELTCPSADTGRPWARSPELLAWAPPEEPPALPRGLLSLTSQLSGATPAYMATGQLHRDEGSQ